MHFRGLFLIFEIVAFYNVISFQFPTHTTYSRKYLAIRSHSPICDEIVGWKECFYPTFVSNYFQKRPLLIREAFPQIYSTLNLTAGDFVSLASDEDVETRIYKIKSQRISKKCGPFSDTYIKSLGPKDWSILIQEMDRHIPQVADLWCNLFKFIPNWRRDDVMFSYSMPGGSIGGHVDNYDVFLLHAR